MSKFKRAGVLSVAVMQLFWACPAFADAVAASCTGGSSGQGSVLAVIGDGYIRPTGGNTGDNDQCNTKFMGGSSFDVNNSNFNYAGKNGSTVSKKCQDLMSGAALSGGSSGMSRPTLPDYPTDMPTTAAGSPTFEQNRQADNGAGVSYAADLRSATLSADRYDVSMQNQYVLTLDATAKGTDGLKFNSVTVPSVSGAKLILKAPGIYIMRQFSIGAGAVLEIEGTGTAEIRLWKAPSINGGKTCINFKNCANTEAMVQIANNNNATAAQKQSLADMLSEEEPGRLQINVYAGGSDGNMSMQNNLFMSAGIYLDDNEGAGAVENGRTVHGGNLWMGSGPLFFVGQALASNVDVQNNTNTVLYNKVVSTPAAIETTPLAISLAPPAVPPVSTTGTLIYRPMQRDVQPDGTKATSGHLVAVKLTDKAASGDTAWDAADKQSVSDRRTKLYSQIATPTGAATDFELLTAVAEEAFGPETNRSDAERIINPNHLGGRYLEGRLSSSLIGQPGRSQPIIVGKSVLFATADGILYSVNRSTGALQWGWIPRQMLPLTAQRTAFSKSVPWGQLSSVRLYATDKTAQNFVLGTALQGQLHFSIKVSDDGATLEGVAWQDYQENRYSPGSTTYVGAPLGGAAPLPMIGDSQRARAKAAYIVNNQLMTRRIDGGDIAAASETTSAMTGADGASTPVLKSFSSHGQAVDPVVSSNLLYLSDSEIYLGAKVSATDSRVWKLSASGALSEVQISDENGNLSSVRITEPILSIVGAPISSADGSGKVILAQTPKRVVALKYLNGAWSKAWTAATDEATATGVVNIPASATETDPEITAPPAIMNGKVVIPVTRQTSVCGLAGKVAYMFGPLDLVSGASNAGSWTFDGNSITGLWNKVGDGLATGISMTSYSPNSDSVSNTPNTLIGSGSGNTAKKSGTEGGEASDKSMLGPGAGVTDRLNWRELTNFF